MTFNDYIKALMDKRENKNLYRNPLKNRDLALFIVVFTVVFGVLSATPRQTLLGLFVGVAHIAFWVGMSFTGGRRLAKGYYIPASIIWGCTLLLTFLNFLLKDNPLPSYGAVTDTLLVSAIMILQFIAMAVINPIFPLFFYLGYYPGHSANPPLELLLISVFMFVILGLVFVFGFIYEKIRPLGSKNTRNPYVPPNAKE